MAIPELRAVFRQRVLISDGATGTTLGDLLEEETGHRSFPEDCPEALNISHPDIVGRLHERYLAAGSDIVLTNSFGASPLTLSEYGLDQKAEKINHLAATLACREVDKAGTGWAIGSLGPGSLLPSLGHVSFQRLRQAYVIQVKGLLRGGVDGFLVETCQDPLQAKAALSAIRHLVTDPQKGPLVIVSLTVGEAERMLLGTTLDAALTTLLPFKPDSIGINCGAGPDILSPALSTLASLCPLPLWFKPNAGLPVKKDGHTVFPMGPDEFASLVVPLVRKLGIAFVGGCCGTTTSHIKVLEKLLRGEVPKPTPSAWSPSLSSLYYRTPYSQEDSILLVGERSNVNGSRRFRRAIEQGDTETAVSITLGQAKRGANAVDVCVDLLGEEPGERLVDFIRALRERCTLPVFLDSATPGTLVRAAGELPGRGVLNSVTLASGERDFRILAEACRKTGCAMVALAVDEQGQAMEIEDKLRVAKRVDSLRGELGLSEDSVFFDPLTFPIGSGQEELQDAGVTTLGAVEVLSDEFPRMPTILGVSNISHGLATGVRKIINSVMLKLAQDRGLTAAIVHAGQIIPLHTIQSKVRIAAEELLLRGAEREKLIAFLAMFDSAGPKREASSRILASSPLLGLRQMVINGEKAPLREIIDSSLKSCDARDLLEEGLLRGMAEVGRLFKLGEMQIPFVLASAEVVSEGSRLLAPHLPSSGRVKRNCVVLATVEGDVHDIGKNLVAIILKNNGFDVVDLGTRVPVMEAYRSAIDHNAIALGLSGLLIQSVEVMSQGLEQISTMRPPYPTLLVGGAALTETYVAEELSQRYPGLLLYAKDAMRGLEFVRDLADGKAPPESMPRAVRTFPPAGPVEKPRPATVPIPPFLGSKLEKSIPLETLFQMLNSETLFSRFWKIMNRDQGIDHLERLRPMLDKAEIAGAGVRGHWHCERAGETDLLVSDPAIDSHLSIRLGRQVRPPHRSIQDFVNPEGDVISLLVVTMGSRGLELADEAKRKNSFSDYFLIHGLIMALTETLARLYREKMLGELGLPGDHGKTYAPGMPALPDLSIHETFFRLLDPWRIGVNHTETWALVPECSASGMVLHHPEAAYFRV